MTDLVVVSLESWDDVWRRNQHLLWRLLQADPGLRVLFVEPAADPTHDLRAGRRPRGPRRPDDAIMPGRLWRMRPIKALPRRVDPRADERVAKQIERAADALGMTHPLLWVNDPGGAELMSRTGWPTLYDMTDDWLSATRPHAELTRVAEQEARLLANADEVVACSPELLARKTPARPPERAPIRLVRNAVDLAAYRTPHARPGDLPEGRVVLYAGTLHSDRLDVLLVESLAAALTASAGIVLVGPNALSPADTARLRSAGALLLGARSRDQLIGYLQHADALIVPHVVDAFTDSLDPIKLYEYQAVGRPVVSTAVAGFRDADDPAITVSTHDSFAEDVARALAGTRDSSRVAPAQPADWGDRAQTMALILAGMPADER